MKKIPNGPANKLVAIRDNKSNIAQQRLAWIMHSDDMQEQPPKPNVQICTLDGPNLATTAAPLKWLSDAHSFWE